MANKVIDYLKKRSTLTETLSAASEKVEKMDRRAAVRAKEQASGGGKAKRKLPRDFLDSFRDDLDAKREENRNTDKVPNLVSNQVSDQVTNQVSGQMFEQMTNQAPDQPTDQATNQTSDQPSDLSQYVVGHQTFDINIKNKPLDLTQRQFFTLHYIYFNRPFKVSGPEGISCILSMGHNNARNQIKSLIRKSYIFKPYRTNIGASGCSTCRVNSDKCFDILGPTSISNPPPNIGETDQPSDQPTNQSNNQSNDQDDSPISSSSFYKKTTTRKIFDSDRIKKELDHPAMANWVKWGLRSTQILKWLKSQQDVSLDDILLSLRHIEFQFLDLGYIKEREEKGNPIRDKFSWFWATFKERGYFIPEPSGYVSWERKRVIQTKAAKEKLKKEQETLLGLELENELNRILDDPDSDEYNHLFGQIDGYLQKRYKRPESRNTPTFRMSMMNALKKLRNCE